MLNKHEEKISRLIEHYLNNEINTEERNRVEMELRTNPAYKRILIIHQIIGNVLQYAALEQEKKMIQKAHRTYFQFIVLRRSLLILSIILVALYLVDTLHRH